MPFSTRVPPLRRIVPIDRDQQVGFAVSARPWGELALLANYIRGRGAVLIPSHGPMLTVFDTGSPSTRTLRWRTKPSGRAILRVWEIEILGMSGSGVAGCEATITIGGGPPMTVGASQSFVTTGRTFFYYETAAETTSVTELTLTITAVLGFTKLTKVACWELPRAQLSKNATEVGIDLSTIDPDRLIIDLSNESISGIGRSIAASDGRRIGLVSWAGAVQVASTTFVPVFQFPIPIVPPKVGNVSTRNLSWDIYARADSGTTGEARVVSSIPSTSANLLINTTSNAWRGPGTGLFLCEDLTHVDGLPSGNYETVQLEVRSTAGIFVHIESFCLWDDTW